jgi:hypothetical protein
MEDDQGQHPESLLPYDEWTQEALRHVVVRALAHAAEHGLPGDHHFYLTFRTDHPGTAIPARLKAQYPHEMTIVLQHQFRDLTVGEGLISVVLSFGGVSSTLVIPLAAVTGFADPCVQFMLRFQPATETAEPEPEPEAELEAETDESEQPATPPQVVSLDAFRRRTPPKE